MTNNNQQQPTTTINNQQQPTTTNNHQQPSPITPTHNTGRERGGGCGGWGRTWEGPHVAGEALRRGGRVDLENPPSGGMLLSVRWAIFEKLWGPSYGNFSFLAMRLRIYFWAPFAQNRPQGPPCVSGYDFSLPFRVVNPSYCHLFLRGGVYTCIAPC